MPRKSSAFRLAPPTRAPSMSGWASSSRGVAGFDAAAVQNANLLGNRRIVAVGQDFAKVQMDLLGLLGRGHLARCRWPKPARRRSRAVPTSARPTSPASEPANCRRMTLAGLARLRARPAVRRRRRSASARRPGRPAPFGSTCSSVSPRMCRRSLWPRITYRQPRSTSIAALISPVKAPLAS